MRCRYCLHLLRPSLMDAGVFDAMRFLRDSTPYPLPDEEIGHHRREAAQRAGITLPVPASGAICGECGCDVPSGPMFVGPWHADPCTFYRKY